ncbi:MAG TPA: GNAT family protein [Steroidobacteraceae bacterium]|nr:GNAT family protein [Steroidobacteraceae bacterium]
MSWIAPLTLKGTHVHLEPLSPARHDELVDALHDGELWQLWYAIVPTPAELSHLIEQRLAQQASGAWLPFAIIEAATGTAVGMTNFIDIDAPNRRLEIGGTWYRRRAQRTALNTECKLLLLRHAFEQLGCIAVEFRTHFFNQQSRRAIERLGAKLDGVLRNHRMLSNGSLRDTCVYSIVREEWAAVKANLEFRLGRGSG